MVWGYIMELNKKLKVYNAIQNALGVTIITSGILVGSGLLAGVASGIHGTSEGFKLNQKMKVVEKSEEYQQYSESVVENAYNQYTRAQTKKPKGY
jgi:hypothetical protein